jgi:hypothetical protein
MTGWMMCILDILDLNAATENRLWSAMRHAIRENSSFLL